MYEINLNYRDLTLINVNTLKVLIIHNNRFSGYNFVNYKINVYNYHNTHTPV